MKEQKIGWILDNMGVRLELDPDDQIIEVIVIAKVSKFEGGGTALCHGSNQGIDWVAQQGLIHSAIVTIDNELRNSLSSGDD